jgi:hypothetical protein
MATVPSFVEENARELERMRALVERLSDDELNTTVTELWNVADALGHIAFWDGHALVLGKKLAEGVPFSPSDEEPEEVDWANDAAWVLIHAIAPRDVAALALRVAEETDRRMASLPPERMYPSDPESPLNALRADHRGEHLDQIEAALGR